MHLTKLTSSSKDIMGFEVLLNVEVGLEKAKKVLVVIKLSEKTKVTENGEVISRSNIPNSVRVFTPVEFRDDSISFLTEGMKITRFTYETNMPEFMKDYYPDIEVLVNKYPV